MVCVTNLEFPQSSVMLNVLVSTYGSVPHPEPPLFVSFSNKTVVFGSQLSASLLTTRTFTGGIFSIHVTVRVAGLLAVGGVVSVIVKMAFVEPAFPQISVAVKVIVIVCAHEPLHV